MNINIVPVLHTGKEKVRRESPRVRSPTEPSKMDNSQAKKFPPHAFTPQTSVIFLEATHLNRAK